jgi:hypothetical protein
VTSAETAIVEYAQRAAKSARECADALVESRQAWERVEVRQDEQARDIREIKTRLATLSQPRLQPMRHASLTEEDFEDSPTGTHKLVSRRRFDEWARERDMSVDAKRWRKVLQVSGRIAIYIAIAIAGWLLRHYLGHP